MENVGITSNQISTNNYSLLTGHTVNYGDISIHYVRVGIFSKLNKISTKQLQRYRDQIVTEKVDTEHRFYFHSTDGIYYYTERILDKRKYKSAKKEKEIQVIDHKVQGFTGSLLSRIKKQKWDFACVTNYKQELQISDCVERMKGVNELLNEKFPKAGITMFYTTEANPENEGYHNHLVLSFNTTKTPSLTSIRKALSNAGTSVPWAKVYDPTKKYIDYIVKEIDQIPDGWNVISTDQEAYSSLICGLPETPLYIPEKNEDWQKDGLEWLY